MWSRIKTLFERINHTCTAFFPNEIKNKLKSEILNDKIRGRGVHEKTI